MVISIFPFNPNVFSNKEFEAANLGGENLLGVEDHITLPYRNIMMVIEEEVSTSELSDLRCPSAILVHNHTYIISAGWINTVGPLSYANRGLKSLKSTI